MSALGESLLGNARLDWRAWAGACLAMVLVALAYWPGLAGSFLFDDFANLDELAAFAPYDDWQSVVFYLTSGTADPTGRPVALLSFLIDAQDWPAEPWPFKRTNLVLHLINTALLAAVLSRLQIALSRKHPAVPVSRWSPLLAALLWGAHPLFVSTTLYVVQREAMLPATFVLLGLLAWDRAMAGMARGKTLRALTWAVLGLGTCTLLAGFSKANGFLAPLMVGLVYLWCYRPSSRPERRTFDRLAGICLGIPSMLVIAYLVNHAVELWSLPSLQGRDWTLPERLLSEPRALWDYVFRLAVPRAGGGGLYVDDFAVSRGWLDPVTTLPSIVFLSASVVAAIAWRRRVPMLSLAWLFFLAAHLLESSVVALELYFEHRNYLPAMLLGWPVAHGLLRPGPYPRARVALAATVVAMLLLLANQRAIVWGNPAVFTAVSAEHREDSIRSQVTALHLELRQGRGKAAVSGIHELLRNSPDSVLIALNAITIECMATGRLATDTMERSKHALSVAKNWNYGLYTWLRDAANAEVMRECRGFGTDGTIALVEAGLANPENKGSFRRREFLHARGQIALAAGQPDEALRWFDAALALDPDPNYALVQAAALGNAGAQAAGVEHLDHFARLERTTETKVRDMRSLHRWLLVRCGYYQEELQILRARLAADAAAQAPGQP